MLCTHLHVDHVGLNTRLLGGRWVPTFPKARYLFARPEWEHWRVAEARARYTTDLYYEDSLLPVMDSGQAELVTTDYALDDNVWIEPWPGHTPGHVCVVVRFQQASVVLSGDIMHTALQCAEPQLNSCGVAIFALRVNDGQGQPRAAEHMTAFGARRPPARGRDSRLLTWTLS